MALHTPTLLVALLAALAACLPFSAAAYKRLCKTKVLDGEPYCCKLLHGAGYDCEEGLVCKAPHRKRCKLPPVPPVIEEVCDEKANGYCCIIKTTDGKLTRKTCYSSAECKAVPTGAPPECERIRPPVQDVPQRCHSWWGQCPPGYVCKNYKCVGARPAPQHAWDFVLTARAAAMRCGCAAVACVCRARCVGACAAKPAGAASHH